MRTTMMTFLLAAATSTAAWAAPVSAQPNTALPDSVATLTVQNNRNVPVTVFVEQGELDVRVGMVPALRTSTLALPSWVTEDRNELQVFVHPEGGIDLNAEVMAVKPGAHLALEVPKGMNTPARPTQEMTAKLPPNENGSDYGDGHE